MYGIIVVIIIKYQNIQWLSLRIMSCKPKFRISFAVGSSIEKNPSLLYPQVRLAYLYAIPMALMHPISARHHDTTHRIIMQTAEFSSTTSLVSISLRICCECCGIAFAACAYKTLVLLGLSCVPDEADTVSDRALGIVPPHIRTPEDVEQDGVDYGSAGKHLYLYAHIDCPP